jgi:hypothetical protein
MAAPRMKAPTKKKVAVKKPKVGTVKSPAETRKSISRKQVGTSRPARGLTPEGAKARALTGMKQPGRSLTVTNRGSLTTPNKRAVAKTGEQVAEKARTAITRTAKNAVGFAEKWIPNAIRPKGGGMGLINKAGGVATAVTSIVNPDFMNFKTEKTKAGELEAAKPSGSPMGGRKLTDKENAANAFRKKPSGTYFPTAKSKVSSTTGAGRPEYPSSNKGKKASGNTSGVGGPGGARALTDVKSKKSGTSKAESVAASSGSSGGSQASKVGVGRQTRYQRDETAMEQRKSSSGKPKKSIFSLFRKG